MSSRNCKRMITIWMILLYAANGYAQRTGAVDFKTEHNKASRKIAFEYQLAQSPLKDAGVLKGVLYYFVNDALMAMDLDLSGTGPVLKGTFRLPGNAQSYALFFSAGRNVDNNEGKGYIVPLVDDRGPVKGAYATEAIFRSNFGSSVLRLKQDESTVLALLEKELAMYPKQGETVANFYLSESMKAKPLPEALAILDKVIADSMSADYTEKKLTAIQSVYFKLKQKGKNDTLQKLMVRRFPKSDQAFGSAAYAMYTMENSEAMEKYTNELIARFDLKGSLPSSRGKLDQLYSLVAQRALEEGEVERFKKCANELAGSARAYLNYNCSKLLIEKASLLPLADSLAEAATAFASAKLNDTTGRPVSTSPWLWRMEACDTYAEFASHYAERLFKKGAVAQAVTLQANALEKADYMAEPYMYNNYLQYLAASGDYEKVYFVAEKMIREDYYGLSALGIIRTAYTKHFGSADGFNQWFGRLDEKGKQNRSRVLEQEMFDLPAPDFTLRDQKGNTVSLSGLKGKVVVLDFWATWCGPCKASMPGMQQAVNYFAADSNVVFLFINTRERMAQPVREKQVTDFLAKQQYSFTVLYDEPVDETKKKYTVVEQFKVEGIPTKLVIDPHGRIRFRTVGFDPNAEGMVKELATMIDMLKL